MPSVKKADILSQLQSEILRLEGFKRPGNKAVDLGLGPIAKAFPGSSFPLGAVHEFLSFRTEDTAATCGFLAGMLSQLMGKKGTGLWISSARTLFPPALRNFGIEPDRIIFTDLGREKHVLWALEEALKCSALAAVVGELKDLSFIASRRLQLAVEGSSVTAFVIRNAKHLNTTACVSRWKITSLPSEAIGDLPGIGSPQWRIELLKVRNGKPGIWNMRWVNARFEPVYPDSLQSLQGLQRKAG